MKRLFAIAASAIIATLYTEPITTAAEWTSDGEIVLENGEARVVISPAKGGRIMQYSWKGKKALEPVEAGPGRFDIGPERIVPKRRELWEGVWNGEITGELSARVTSVEHKETGVQLIRDSLHKRSLTYRLSPFTGITGAALSPKAVAFV